MKVCLSILTIFYLFSDLIKAQNLENISKQPPVTLSGGITLQSNLYNASGIPDRSKPFSYIITGSPTISFYNSLTIPFTFTYSEQERSYRQPFNQFGMSPYYKWITVHAGYRNVTFSQYTLAGHTFLGAGVEIHPGIFRFGFIYGRFNRATAVDSTTRALQPYTYSNHGFATKIGIGKGSNFLDFSLLKAKDDSSSVHPTGSFMGLVTPEENVVIGMNGQTRIYKNFTFSLEAATSLFTRDLNNKSVNHDSASNIITKLLDGFISTNGSTEHYNALQTALGYQDKILGLKIQYNRIDPNYKSMGAYFFSSDIENITFAPSLNILKSKLRLTGSLGIQHDNLNKQKQSTSSRVIGSANASANLNDYFGFDFSYSNYSNSQRTKTILLRDTFRIAQVSQNFSLTPHYIYAGTKYVHSIVFSANYNLFTSLDNSTNIQNNTKSYNLLLNYQITLVPKNLSFSTNLNYTDVKADAFEEGNYGLTLGVTKTMLKSKLTIGWLGSFLKGIRGGTNGLILNQSINGNYRINKHNALSANFNFINNHSQNTNLNPTYSELRGYFSYRYIF